MISTEEPTEDMTVDAVEKKKETKNINIQEEREI